MKKIFKFAKKLISRELIIYGIFGVLTVITNIVAYWMLSRAALSVLAANTIAFFIAVTFAYFTNTLIVFRSKPTIRNCIEFFTMRIATLAIDDGGLWLLIHRGMNDMVAKCIDSVVIIIINYLCSKFYIYNRKNKNQRSE
jgi:putative flippase GtrA